jgi:hypothetical protein
VTERTQSEQLNIEDKMYLMSLNWKNELDEMRRQTQIEFPSELQPINSKELLKPGEVYQTPESNDPLNYKIDHYKVS